MNRRSRMVWTGLAAIAALAQSCAAAWAAPAYPEFPRSQGAGETRRWLTAQSDLPLASVVLVGPGYAFAFQPADPQVPAGGLVGKKVREEVTSAVMASRLNGRSATATIAFDCARNQATASDVLVYPGNNLQGGPGRSVAAADWLTANPGLYLMDLAEAACSPAFRGPFSGSPSPALATAPRSISPNQPPTRTLQAETGPEHWVQVGAFAGVAAAGQRWREIQRALGARAAGESLRTEPVGGGKTLVRALIGPFHGPEAQAFCTALKAQGGDCLVR